MKSTAQSGFTMIEATIVAALLATVLTIVGTSMSAATASMRMDDRIALSMETLQRSAVRIAQILRPCSLSTYRVPATDDDVPEFAAAAGDWMEPIEGDPRPAVQFRAANGRPSLNASELTGERVLRLQLEPTELDNGIDDDGDGLVDEGRVMLDYDGVPVALASNIEAVSFVLVNRLLTIELHSAERGQDGRVKHFSLREVLYLRNN